MASVQGSTDLSLPEENDLLLDDIMELLESPECESPEVILLIGRSGAGKSGLINTVHKALTGKYFTIAKQGSGVSLTVTMDLNRYVNCGVKPNRVTNARLKELVPRLPHIVDCAGLADEKTERLSEILELLVGGYIPPKTSILALDNVQDNYGIGGLKKLYTESNPAWKVTKVVFMQGCTDAIPKNLIQCLREILTHFDENTLVRKYQCEVFVLISKYDLVRDSNNPTLPGLPVERSITQQEFEDVEKTLEEEFNFAGNREHSRIKWISLTDNVGFDSPLVDNIALRFLKRMIEPGVPTEQDTDPVISTRKKIVLFMHRLYMQIGGFLHRGIHIDLSTLVALVFFIVVLVFFYSLLGTQPVNVGT